MIEGWITALKTVEDGVQAKGILRVLFVLPDGFGAERVRILVDGTEIASGVFKHGNDAAYEAFFFLPENTECC